VHHIVSTNIAFNFVESDPFQVLCSKNQFPGSREFPANGICFPAFPRVTKWLSRGNTNQQCTRLPLSDSEYGFSSSRRWHHGRIPDSSAVLPEGYTIYKNVDSPLNNFCLCSRLAAVPSHYHTRQDPLNT
jgi:hypothetical protein